MKLYELIKSYGYGVIKITDLAYEDQKINFQDKSENLTIFDIGSHEGKTVMKYRNIFPKSIIYSFEPIKELYEKQKMKFKKDSNILIYQKIISDVEGKSPFNINKIDATSSILEPNFNVLPNKYAASYDTLENTTFESDRIDSFCKNNNIRNINILKCDVQGAELKILKSAERLLLDQKIDLIYLECSFVELYSKQCMFDEIIVYLFATKYRLHSIYDIQYNFSSGRILQCDAIFVSESEYLNLKSKINFIK